MSHTMRPLLSALALALACACVTDADASPEPGPSSAPADGASASDPNAPAPLTAVPEGAEVAVFAGGCFWCSETDFEKIEGVLDVMSGYVGGRERNPSYKQVSYGRTGHIEAVRVVFDTRRVTYDDLLFHFWRTIDPTTRDRQFCDRGRQYRSGIFPRTPEQRRAAEASKLALNQQKPFAGDIVTEITDADVFWPAENYHQDFYKKNPSHYTRYRIGCGRDARVRALWGEEAGGLSSKKKTSAHSPPAHR